MVCNELIRLFRVRMDPRAPEFVREVLTSGYIGEGVWVERFERELQRELGLSVAPLAVSSATAGLELIYRLLGINRHAYVISTPMTCLATNAPLALLKAKIVWADVSPITGLIDPCSVDELVTELRSQGHEPAAIVAVDLGGKPADYESLRAFGVPIIRDAAHSILAPTSCGTSDQGGDFVVWSFQAIKHLTCGDGGAVLVPERFRHRARLLRWYGFDRTKSDKLRCDQLIKEIGNKWHMNNIAAAIGLANLPGLRDAVQRHRHNAQTILQLDDEDRDASSWWYVSIIARDPVRVSRIAEQHGIECCRVHRRNDLYPALRSAARELPGVDNFDSLYVGLSCGWWLDDSDIARVVRFMDEIRNDIVLPTSS